MKKQIMRLLMMIPRVRRMDEKDRDGIVLGIIIALSGAVLVLTVLRLEPLAFIMPSAHASTAIQGKEVPVFYNVDKALNIKQKRRSWFNVNWPFPEPTEFYFALGPELSDRFCDRGPTAKGKGGGYVSNIGLRQTFWQSPGKWVSAFGAWEHNSCAVFRDRISSDRLYIGLSAQFWGD